MIKGTKPISATVPIFCSGSLKIWYVCSLVISCSLKSAINYNFNTLKSLVKKSRTNYFLPRLAPLLMMNFFGQLPSIILTQYDIFELRVDWIYLLPFDLILWKSILFSCCCCFSWIFDTFSLITSFSHVLMRLIRKWEILIEMSEFLMISFEMI